MSFEDHRACLVEDFLDRRPYAECSCGWVGEKAESRHLALADHAAHVHVAEGLAVPEDQP